MIAAVITTQYNGMTTPAQLSAVTNLSDIDLHHALAALDRNGFCRIEKGVVSMRPSRKDVLDFVDAYN